MTKQEEIRLAQERAQTYFDAGCNCAESVARTFLEREDQPFPAETAALATAFGGGMGRTHNTCGAVTGALFGLGCYCGRDPMTLPTAEERHRDISPRYERSNAMMREIEQTLQTLLCRELTASYDFASPQRRARCREVVGICAGICAKHICEWKQEH